MASPTIISLAILKVNWDRLGRDYIENFVPLVAECIRVSRDEVVSAPAVQKSLRGQFGLDLPQFLIDTILKRVRKRGYISLDHGTYKPNRARLEALEFRETRDEIVRMHEAVIRRLTEFSQEKFGVDWTEDEGEAALLAFLEDNELLVVGLADRGTLIPHIEYPQSSAKFVVASFIKSLLERHSGDLEYFDTVVKGNMLANAIFLPDPHDPYRGFKNTEVYFDTSFLIYALGYAGEARREPCDELIDLLYQSGAHLRCFRHTLDEVAGALEACGSQLIRGRKQYAYGPGLPTFEYFLSRGFTATDVDLLIGRLETDLASMRIRVADKPPYHEKITIDEAGLSELIGERISYSNPRALERDVDSVSAVYRLRTWNEYRLVENCRAIFVTTNTRLVKTVNEYFYKDANASSVSPCTTDYTLTNLVWLKRPNSAPDLPRKRVIADCLAATQPGDELWSAYLAEIEKLEQQRTITPHDYYYLRYSIEAKNSLMDLTLGEREAFTQGTVAEILDLYKERARADLVEQLDASRSRVRALETEREDHKSKIRSRSTRAARWVGKILRFSLVALIIVGTLGTAPWVDYDLQPPQLSLILWILWLCVASLSIISLFRGTTVELIIRRIELGLTRVIEKLLLRLI